MTRRHPLTLPVAAVALGALALPLVPVSFASSRGQAGRGEEATGGPSAPISTRPAAPQGAPSAAGASDAANAADDAEAAELPPLDPAEFETRIAGVVAATKRGEWNAALAFVDPLLSRGQLLSEYDRAEAHFAQGLVLFLAEEETPSQADRLLGTVPMFESARALAGPRPLRLDATYDAALARLQTAERWRAHLPEVAQGENPPPQVPLPPPPPPKDPSKPEPPPDPLDVARAIYLLAKDAFVERLRADWRDADTRANLELIQRRLAELDAIEQQREEQQQEQQDQQQQGDENQEGEPEENDEDQDPSEDQSDEQDQEEKSDEQQQEQEQEQDPEQQPGEENAPQPEEVEPPEEGQGEAHGDPGDSERLLTREEVMRLLDKLGELEKEREALEAAIRATSRIPVDRDW